VVQGLDELWQRRVIYEQGDDAYDFSHDKLRETAYLTLSAPKRRHLHQRVAEALLALHATRLDTISGQIAFHYEGAGLIEKALFYYEQASVAALHVYANIEASTALQHAIDLHQAMPQPQLTEIARLYERLGDIFHLTGHSDACLEMFQKAIALLPHTQPRWLARLHRKTAGHWNSITRPADGIQAYQESERLLNLVPEQERDTEWQQEWLQLQFDQLWTLSLLNRAHEMDRILTLVQQPVAQLGTLLQQAHYFQCLCLRDTRLMRYRVNEPVIDAARTALSLCQQTHRPGDIGNFMYTLGSMLMWAGQFTEAAEYLQKALALEEQVGDITLQLFGQFLLSMLFRRQKQPDRVRQCAERLLHGPYQGYQPMAYASQAWLAWRENHVQQARHLAEQALALWQQTYPFQWTALWPLLAIALQQNRLSASIEYVRQLLDPMQEAYSAPLTLLLESALQSWQRNQPEQAHQHLCEAIAQARQENYL
jgi:Tfp pilus assembly protein PilF